jgi:hypothetical protein
MINIKYAISHSAQIVSCRVGHILNRARRELKYFFYYLVLSRSLKNQIGLGNYCFPGNYFSCIKNGVLELLSFLFYYEISNISVENVLQTKSWSSGIRNYLEDHDGNIAYILYMGEL